MSVNGCVWGYWCAGSTILCTERHGGMNICLIWGYAWPGNFPVHHVLTCMTQKNEKRIKNTQYMGQGQHNTCIQLKQKQTWPKSIIKLAQPINSDTCNFWQKHNNTKLGVLIDQKNLSNKTCSKFVLDSVKYLYSTSKCSSEATTAKNSPNR